MPVNLEVMREKVVERWRVLEARLCEFTERLGQESRYPAFFPQIDYLPEWAREPFDLGPDLFPYSARERCVLLFRQLEYLDDQPPKETLVAPGALGASPETLRAAHALNEAKDGFKAALIALRKRVKRLEEDHPLNDAFARMLASRDRGVHTALRRSGLARLCLKQVQRHVPVLDRTPDKISWSWARTRSIRRLSVEDVEVLLEAMTSPAASEYLERLRAISRHEPLAQIAPHAPHLRANLLFPAELIDRRTRYMIHASVPILYPSTPGASSPELRVPAAEREAGERNRDADRKIEDQPFLPALHIYRYRREHRVAARNDAYALEPQG